MLKLIRKRFLAACCIVMLLLSAVVFPALAYEPSTLHNGSRGEEVRELQQDLITLGYLKGKADGVFGKQTENAVRSFQRKNKLTADGLAGAKTRALIRSKASGSASSAPAPSSASPDPTPAPAASGSSLFGGNYATIRSGQSGARVRTLQQALISLNYLKGNADGKFGKQTKAAVTAFQKANGLKADGIAGKKTLTALEKAGTSGPAPAPAATAEPTPAPAASESTAEAEAINPKIDPPAAGSVKLLSWYDDVKTSLSNGQQLLVYDPSSGLSWTLRVYARGRHCDAEPLTAQDTATLLKAFGGTKTWSQKGVYVRLPDGRWTVAATHDVPHDSSSIKDNNFDGHLCVHFYRTMEETKQNDPNYGVSNQETIRALWKSLTGQTITD